MKIIVIGASGDVGTAICNELGPRHDLIRVGRSTGDIHADIADRTSIRAMYAKTGTVDAVMLRQGFHGHRSRTGVYPQSRSA